MFCDLFHEGHVQFLRNALQYGDKLYIGLASDKQMKSFNRNPIIYFNERKAVLETCCYVNKVIENPPMPITKDFIDKYNIDVVVQSNDISNSDINYWYKDAIVLDKFKAIHHQPTLNTHKIIQRITDRMF